MLCKHFTEEADYQTTLRFGIFFLMSKVALEILIYVLCGTEGISETVVSSLSATSEVQKHKDLESCYLSLLKIRLFQNRINFADCCIILQYKTNDYF